MFSHILTAVEALKSSNLPDPERLKQLEIFQTQTVTLARAVRPELIDRDDPSRPLVVWERLARRVEAQFPGRVPPVDSIADAQLPIVGENRSLHVAPPERVSAWLEHTTSILQLLVSLYERRPATTAPPAVSNEPANADVLLEPDEKAVYLMAKHPDWTMKDVAEALGVSRATLYTWDRVRRYLEARNSKKGSSPKGWKNRESGRVEGF